MFFSLGFVIFLLKSKQKDKNKTKTNKKNKNTHYCSKLSFNMYRLVDWKEKSKKKQKQTRTHSCSHFYVTALPIKGLSFYRANF